MLESLSVPAMYVADQAVSSLCTSGPITGIALVCGDELAQVVADTSRSTTPPPTRLRELTEALEALRTI